MPPGAKVQIDGQPADLPLKITQSGEPIMLRAAEPDQTNPSTGVNPDQNNAVRVRIDKTDDSNATEPNPKEKPEDPDEPNQSTATPEKQAP